MKPQILFYFILFFSTTANAQPCNANFLGSKTLYEAQQSTYAKLPNGYQPVFINHVGRHGSRHLTKEVNTAFIYTLLHKADSLKALTPDGKLLIEKIGLLEKIEKKNVKSISYRGKAEQVAIADRMQANYPQVFNQTAPVINICYTKEIRTLQTCNAFMDGLITHIAAPVVTKKINDTTLRFYDLSPAYTNYKEKGVWLQNVAALKTALKYPELTLQITQRFFSFSFLQTMDEAARDNFTTDLYGFITIFYSIQKEIEEAGYTLADVDMRPLLTCKQLLILNKLDNAEDYYAKGPANNIDGIQIKIALPLLADFITTTQAYINTKNMQAQLRFSHAETISPFATLLGLASKKTKTFTAIENAWNADKVIPLSSNIQWVIYKKENTENYLIKFLLNEKETAVSGLSTATFPYYKWEDVKAFYLKKMSSLNASLSTNFLDYLKQTN